MRRSVAARLVAFLTALVVSLTAPGLAVAHGLAHAHLAHEHADTPADHGGAGRGEPSPRDEHHADGEHREPAAPAPSGAVPPLEGARDDAHGDLASPAVAPADHGHRHGHATVAVAPGARDLTRIHLPPAAAAALAPPVPPGALVVVRAAALGDRALLARPAPESGPPPRLRAPPVR